MTAIDAAVQAKLLGAEEVTICYRRGKEHMNASEFEQDLAASKGVTIRHWLQPKRIAVKDGRVAGIELDYTTLEKGKLTTTGETGIIAADQISRPSARPSRPPASAPFAWKADASSSIRKDAPRWKRSGPAVMRARGRGPHRFGRRDGTRCRRIDRPGFRRGSAAGERRCLKAEQDREDENNG